MFTLQGMRKPQRHKWLVTAFIWAGFGLLIISFVFFYGWNNSHTDHEDRTFARITLPGTLPWGNRVDLKNQAMNSGRVRAINAKRATLPGELSQMLAQQNVSLDGLVSTRDAAVEAANQMLMSHVAKEEGIHVDRGEITDLFKNQNGVTYEMLENYAHQMGFSSVDDMIEAQRVQQQDMRVRNVVAMGAHASLFELWQEYSLAHETMRLKVAGYPAESYTSKVPVTDADLQKYLDAHMTEYHVPAQRRYAFIKYTKEQAKATVQPTDEQLKAYYEQHQADFMQKASRRALEINAPLSADRTSTEVVTALNTIHDRVATADDWTTIVTELEKANPKLSLYPSSTGWIDYDQSTRPAAYMDALKKTPIGKVSDPIIQPTAVYLIKPLEERTASPKPFDTVKGEIIDRYKNEKADEIFKATYEKYRAEEDKHHENLRDFAQALGVNDTLTTTVEATATSIPEIGSFSPDTRDYLQTLTPKVVSEVLRMEDFIAVLSVVDEKPAHDPPLDEVRGKIDHAFREEKALDLARQAAEQAQRLIDSGADFDKALADAPKPPSETTEITRTQSVSTLGGTLQNFTQQTLNVHEGSHGLSPYGMGGGKPDGYAVWKVTALIPAKQEEFAKDRKEFEADYIQLQRQTIVREWLKDQLTKGKFEMVENK